MFTFDPSVGNGATLIMLDRSLLSELSMRVSDASADRGNIAMADSFWQMGVMVNA
jgi:hypothetical protein